VHVPSYCYVFPFYFLRFSTINIWTCKFKYFCSDSQQYKKIRKNRTEISPTIYITVSKFLPRAGEINSDENLL
jgi:hypothetical protein